MSLRVFNRWRPPVIVAGHTEFDPSIEPPLIGDDKIDAWTELTAVADHFRKVRKAGRATVIFTSRESRPRSAATQLSRDINADRTLPVRELISSGKQPNAVHDIASFTSYLLRQYSVIEQPNIILMTHTPLTRAVDNRPGFEPLQHGWHVVTADPQWQNQNYEPAAEQKHLPKLYEQRYQTEI